MIQVFSVLTRRDIVKQIRVW